MRIPKMVVKPVIDGDLGEWKDLAFSDGLWDLDRVKKTNWYNAKRNKLTLHEGEDSNSIDLNAEYYMAWDSENLYFGATVTDNYNDITELNHEPKRWYYKDAIAWFIELPRDTIPEKFEEGNHAFAFVADTTYPDYGAWWRHGSAQESYLEEPIPTGSFEYRIEMEVGSSNYTIEARIHIARDIGFNFNDGQLKQGDLLSMMIVHCDPDGGEYGGHMLTYGAGDIDSSWSEILLVAEKDD